MVSGNCGVCKIVGLLAAIGAVNWGLVGFFEVDLVAQLLGTMTTGARVVYGLIGIAGVIKLFSFVMRCPCCKPGTCETKK